MREHGILPRFENLAQVQWLLAEGFSFGALELDEEDYFAKEDVYTIADEVKKKYPAFYLGIIGVETLRQAKRAIEAGADFIIPISINKSVIKYAQENNVSVFPVVYVKKDVDKAISLGLDTVAYHPILIHEEADPLDFPSETYKGVNYIFFGVECERWDIYICNDIRRSCILTVPKTDARTFLRSAQAKVLGFKFMHLGINNHNEKQARQVIKTLGDLLFIPVSERADAAFLGSEIEVLFKSVRGQHGHIGYSVNNMERALAYLKKHGIGIIEQTAQYDDGGVMRFVYTDLEVGGFAVHLRQL
jgi:2-dehydro-3-deoxyphosphogluconate aldolase/(4S)-4-hydroxy-2-oxoglutarate aldolase